MKKSQVSLIILLVTTLAGGCASSPPVAATGFLSDYSKLQSVDESRMRYVSPEAGKYQAYIVEPVQFLVPPEQLDAKQREEVANYFHNRLTEVIQKRGLQVTQTPGINVARIRIAMTGIADSTWWQKVHPVSKMSGAGTGGAAMEGEVIDSLDGRQIGATVQTAPGNQFDFTAFSTVADVKNVIDRWADQFGRRLDELRANRP